MNLDIDFLMELMRKNMFGELSKELGEQETQGGTETGGGAQSAKAVKKWESGRTLGKTYGGPGYKWESGRKFGKTYMNDPKYVWKSDRNIGKTGGSDFA